MLNTVIAETVGAGVLNGLLRRFNRGTIAHTAHNPAPRAAKRSLGRMYDGYEAVAKQQGVKSPQQVDLELNVPPSDLQITDDFSPYTTNGINVNTGNPSIRINPEADEAILAHELGHVISRQTPVGKMVRELRDNPKLKTALLGAMVTVPGLASALEAGDDDMDTAMATALLASAPAIVDETAANINAYGVMNNAGRRGMDGRQARRLAGGYLSYLALPLLAGASGNIVGNFFDRDKPYNPIAN